jgi:hypothetical protein
MTMMIIIEHECKGGTVLGENQQEDEGEKERLPRGEEDQSTLQIYV